MENLNKKLGNELRLLKDSWNETIAKNEYLTNGCRSGKDSGLGFQRQVCRALEKEVQMLKEQNNALSIKICEIQGYDGNHSNNLFRILRSELELKDPKDILSRVLYLREYYSQTKEIKNGLTRISALIREKTNRKIKNFSEIIEFLQELILSIS